jgi:hypothetical protein
MKEPVPELLKKFIILYRADTLTEPRSIKESANIIIDQK